MEILLIEPFFTGSHAQWANGYARHSEHIVRTLSLSGAHWKWRMHGGAVTLARKFLEVHHRPDLLLATDMLDMTTFLALTRARTAEIPTAIYFHENQINYPWSPKDRDLHRERDKHYGFINFASTLACDRVFFNSQYHMESFLSALPEFLHQFPDHQEMGQIDQLREKCSVLPLGFEFSKLDLPGGRPGSTPVPSAATKASRVTAPPPPTAAQGQTSGAAESSEEVDNRPPLILWNHRWEYDKNPEEFFEALKIVKAAGMEFEVALLGESFDVIPDCFAHAEVQLGDRVVQFGYAETHEEYTHWLHRADILPVTSNQDFFGAAVIEAVYCNCFPLLPDRLAFPELFPPELRPSCFYKDSGDLVRRLGTAIQQIDRLRKISFKPIAEKYDWRHMAPIYDATFQDLAAPK